MSDSLTFEAWDEEKQTERYQRFYRVAKRLKDEFRQAEEAVRREIAYPLPGHIYAAATELAYALVNLLEQAPAIVEGMGNAEFPDYPYQEGLVEMLQSALDVLALPYEIKRKVPAQEVIKLKPNSKPDTTVAPHS